jgi:hypothetical protein
MPAIAILTPASDLERRLERFRHRLVLVGQRIERGGVKCLRGAALGECELAMASVAEASTALSAYRPDAGWYERSVALLDHAELHVICAEQAAGVR